MAARLARTRRRPARRAFTLLETALAMVIVTVGIVAMVEAQTAFVRANNWSSHEATATYLANELRERMRTLSRHDPVTSLTLQGSGSAQTVAGWGREANETAVGDFDDADDYADLRFGDVAGTGVGSSGNVFQGPIDAFGRVIPEIGDDGQPLRDAQGNILPLRGWAQTVRVEKVDPYNTSTVRALTYAEPAAGAFPGRPFDRFPLRVTVTVWFQDVTATQAESVTEVSWIVPATR